MQKLKDKLVLIIDDDDRNTFALSSYLERVDMKVVVAKNGEEAVKALREGLKPAIILLDMMMPVMDGFETLAAFQRDGVLESTPVIAVTARAMKGDMEKCLGAGAWDYTSKPIDLKVLMDKIETWIK